MALVAIALGGGAWFFLRTVTGPVVAPQFATVLPSPMDLPDFTLIDQNANPFTRESLEGEWSLVFFGFTHCPDICPTTMQSLSIARDRIVNEGLPTSASLRILLISVDPERDSANVLKSYVSNFGADIVGLTGDISELQKLTKTLGIFFARSPADNGDYTVDHSAAVLIINPSAQLQALFSAPHNAEKFVHDLPLIMATK